MNDVTPKMVALQQLISEGLCKWLESRLLKMSGKWWKEYVIPNLSYQQNEMVKRSNIKSLARLDLAALLRIFEKNWYNLSDKEPSLTPENKCYLHEMKIVRNRWAHVSSEGINAKDVNRDLDTIQRFAESWDENKLVQEAAGQLKKNLLKEVPSTPSEKSNLTTETMKKTATGLEIGNIICLKSDKNKKGAVTGIKLTDTEAIITVFIDGDNKIFYESQIEPAETSKQSKSTIDQLHRKLTALQLKNPSVDKLYSLNAARIDIVPYQFMPVMKIIKSEQPRILIADGVGVGKTIEAGLIMRELQARKEVESVLVICPKPLVTEKKWFSEMKRFDEDFTELDGKSLKYCLDETYKECWPQQHNKTILTYSLFSEITVEGDRKRHLKGIEDLADDIKFDMVIVDEAHHIRNSNTYGYRAVECFCRNAESVVFLTATPVQMGNSDLYTLLNLLRPDLIVDLDSFKYLVEPNPHINKALSFARIGGHDWQIKALNALQKAECTRYGQTAYKNTEFQNLTKKLNKDTLDSKARVSAISAIEGFHSFASIINRTRRRDIADFCVRNVETVEVDFTNEQRIFYDAILQFEIERLGRSHGGINIKWMTSTIRRQLSSCVYGLTPFIKEITDKKLSAIANCSISDDEIDLTGEDIEYLRSLSAEIEECLHKLPEQDPKYDALKKIVDQKISMPNNKLMIFSSFRHTLNYLAGKLKGAGIRIGLIHGDIPDEVRVTLRNRFEKDKTDEDAIDVLLFSEVGCEGLDYQFCDAMVNYDLPWNPMRIEQRIGRIDRRGQKSEAVAIYNLIVKGTIDADIYSRCLLRIGVFKESIGDCEEILGEITEKLRDIATNLELTDQQRQEKLKQLADNEVLQIEKQRELEDHQHQFFGLQVPTNNAQQKLESGESYWLSPQAIRLLVETYLLSRCGEGEYILGRQPLKTLRLSKEARQRLLADFKSLSLDKSRLNRQWQRWLEGADQVCRLTFDGECASDNREAQFIMPLHPLVKQAVMIVDTKKMSCLTVRVSTDITQPGEYRFMIFTWAKQGFVQDMELIAVCEDPDLEENLFALLQETVDYEYSGTVSKDDYSDVEKRHYTLWKNANKEHKQKTIEVCNIKLDSLRTSHNAKSAVLQSQLDSADNEKIRRMKQSQLENTEAAYQRRKSKIEEAKEKADIHTEPVAYGIIKIGH
ncbi:RNA polymerase-associated protein RapA [Limihaloglobus sulfuriphilus]|uniref:RNA polymerase-associated protein RapA n=1 Tax=Limihaloglobus sulfuriphilus TaxID=1851148 RepID=A0A1Q2MBK4_9BACT|nr:SNF2-related protein [Limihaloglobus sulfuriphilus]AQQ70061.1 RNA polymerase-associated protein RapA [Limihaloglobus sulfuriphilus]